MKQIAHVPRSIQIVASRSFDEQTVAADDGAATTFVWLLAGVAAFRVFVLCAAFPVFNNVDEQAQLDLIVKYSKGEVPRGLSRFSEESAADIAYYGSPEYLTRPRGLLGGVFPAPWTSSTPDLLVPRIRAEQERWELKINQDSNEPPLYYALAGLWRRLGGSLGIKGGYLLYWIRFLNPFVAAALVWVGFIVARLVFPGRPLIDRGVPVLLAVFPQDTFYSIQSDVLSPLLGGLAFLGVVKWLRTERPSLTLAVLTGLALAGAGLVKTANWPLIAVAMVAIVIRSARLARTCGSATWPSTALLMVCLALPLGGWALRDLVVLGDPTGTAAKIQSLGWTRKPFGQWWNHPLFTPHGLAEFWTNLMASFWRGELFWHARRMAFTVTDVFYWLSSLILLTVALVSLLFGGNRTKAAPSDSRDENPPRPIAEQSSHELQTNSEARPALWLAFGIFAASILLLATISLAFNFGAFTSPSSTHPFLTSGRLLSGALIPFLLLYVYGLDRLQSRVFRDGPHWFVLGVMVAFISISEIVLNAPALSSGYNWFHLP